MQLPWSAEHGTSKKFPQKVGIEALTLPTPVARSKTPPRPLREALRIRMGRTPAKIAGGAEGNW